MTAAGAELDGIGESDDRHGGEAHRGGSVAKLAAVVDPPTDNLAGDSSCAGVTIARADLDGIRNTQNGYRGEAGRRGSVTEPAVAVQSPANDLPRATDCASVQVTSTDFDGIGAPHDGNGGEVVALCIRCTTTVSAAANHPCVIVNGPSSASS